MPLLLHNRYSIRGSLFHKVDNEYYKLEIMNIMTSYDDIHDVVEEQCPTWSVLEICKKTLNAVNTFELLSPTCANSSLKRHFYANSR